MKKKGVILSQNPDAGLRRPYRRRIVGLLALPLFGIFAAFGIAPQTTPVNVPTTEVIETIALPTHQEEDVTSDPDWIWHLDQTRRGDTFDAILDRLNIRDPRAIQYLTHAPEARAFSTQLGPGRSLLSKTSPSGELAELQFQLSSDETLIIKKSDGENSFTTEQSTAPVSYRVQMKSAVINSSLFGATDDAGIPEYVAIKLSEIFASEIDFNLDLRKGDRLSVVYEVAYLNGEPARTGRILAAEFVNQGRVLQAIAFGAPGKESYYSPEGKNLQKAFLRSPLEFSRISSGFSLARFHPVLQKWRAHKGVDYAAPTGTRIKAVADAKVAFVGKQGGYGNVVILNHTNGISTVYGHLSHFAPGLRVGQPIEQGSVIGQVGMSGLATGPHLHYEFRVRGEHRDPLKVALPSAIPLSPEQKASFTASAQPLLEQLTLLHGTDIAAFE